MFDQSSARTTAKEITLFKKEQNQYQGKLAIPTSKEIHLLDTDDILFLKSNGNYTEIHLLDGGVILTSSTLKKYEAKLDPAKFIRPHASYIVQREYIQSFSFQDNSLTMPDNIEVPVSRGKKEVVMDYLRRFMIIAICCFSVLDAYGQLTTWELGADSDYNASFIINGPTTASCACTDNATDRILIYSNDINNPEFTETRPHQNGSYGTTNVIALGPESSVTRQGEVSVIGASNNDIFLGECTIFCTTANFGQDLTFTTDPVYNVDEVGHQWNENGSLTLSWEVKTHIPENQYELVINYDTNSASNTVTITDKTIESYTFECVEGGGKVVRFTTSYNNTHSNFTEYTVSDLPVGPGVINGSVKTQSCVGVDEITIVATLKNPDELTNGECRDSIYTTKTLGSNGTFSVDSLYAGVGNEVAVYEVQAFFTDKEFRVLQSQGSACTASADSIFTASLTNQGNQTTQNNVDFVDITSYVISGTITSDNTSCPLEGVSVREAIGGDSGISPVETGIDGNFSLVVPSGNASYDVYAQFRLGSGAIMDSVITVQVADEDVTGIDFLHTATDTLRGFIGGGCLEFLGQATLDVRSSYGCEITSITTDATGYYEAVLPARSLRLEVADITLDPSLGLELGEVLSGFGGSVTIDFFDATTQDFVYRRPLSVNVLGLPAPSCPGVPHPVVAQKRAYPLTFIVREGETCPTDTGKIVIFDNVSSSGVEGQIVDSVFISNGIATYNLRPGDPNFFGDNTKSITFQAQVGEEVEIITDSVLVTGSVQSGNNFTTAAPTELPFLILRDPPGDQSYAEFIEENTTTLSQTFSTQDQSSAGVWVKASIGTEIFGLDIWGQIQGSFEVTSSLSTSEEFILEITNSQTFRTSNNENIVGEDGDVFVGAAVNFIYSLARKLDFDINECAVELDTTLMLNADGFETTFIYTEDWIRNEVIPTRQAMANNSSLPDSVRYRAGNDVNLWEQVLVLNEELKEEALAAGSENFSLNAGATLGGSKNISKSSSKTIEFTTQVDIGLAAEAGFDFMNNGVTVGVDVNIQSTVGEIISGTNSESTTTNYHIEDGELDNAFSINIAEDPVYGTPVFDLVGGQTSCPHEAGTQRLDDMIVLVAQPVQEIESGNDAFFDFTINSNSLDPDPRSYYLAFDATTSGGAEVSFGGASFASPILIPNIAPGQNIISTPIKVTKPQNLNQYDFEGLEFYLFPTCEDTDNFTTTDLAVPFSISAFFDSPCSDVDMLAPLEGWMISSVDNDLLPITMAGYDLSTDFDQIELQYKREDANWQNSGLIRTKLQLNTGSTHVDWDVSNLEDGMYDLRLLLTCGNVKSFSNRSYGMIDRVAPDVYGIEQPADDVYRPGKEISVLFDEALNCNDLGNADCYLKSLSDNALVSVQLQCDGEKLTIVPITDISMEYNQQYEVGILNVEDQNNNQRTDTIKWEFIVGEPDSDGDGNPDTKDFCNGGNDFIDSDLDGLPDDCDCLPSDPINGRIQTKGSLDFDGVEYISVANQDNLVPTTTNEVTYETWIYPTIEDLGNTDIIVDIPGNLYLSRQTNNLQLFTSSIAAPLIDLDINEWAHFAFVFKTDSLIVYQNGQSIYSNAFIHQNSNAGNPINIGGNQDALYNMDGRMEEFRIWDHARTQSQINYDMHDELTGEEAGLALYFNMNDGIPSGKNTDIEKLTDLSPNFNDGNLVDFMKSGNTSNWVSDSPFDFTLIYALCDSICPDTIMAAIDFAPSITASVGSFTVGALDASPSSSSPVTVELWIKPDPVGAIEDSARIVKDRDYDIFLTSGSKVKSILGGATSLVSNGEVAWNEWTHLALVFDLSETKLYINGEFDSSINFTFPVTANQGSKQIGQQGLTFLGDAPIYVGAVDEVRFWNIARTASEISTNYERMIDPSTAGLEVYYTFNEGIPGGFNLPLSDNNGQTVESPDATGNGNTGTIANCTLVGERSNYVQSPIILKDSDKDGIPDFCDPCNAREKLLLQNILLENVPYLATREIILGENLLLPAAAAIELRSPKVLVRPTSNFELLGGDLLISPEPCAVED